MSNPIAAPANPASVTIAQRETALLSTTIDPPSSLMASDLHPPRKRQSHTYLNATQELASFCAGDARLMKATT